MQSGRLTEALGSSIRGLSATPDGQSLVVISRGDQAQTVLSRVSIADGTVERISEEMGPVMVRGEHPRVSPDGKWIAFSDNADVYVHSLTGGGRVQVSDAGGRRPVWSRDSRRLYYQAAGGTIEATLLMGAEVRVASRVAVTSIPIDDTLVDTSLVGASLLMLSPVRQGPRVLVALDWATSVRRDLAGRRGP